MSHDEITLAVGGQYMAITLVKRGFPVISYVKWLQLVAKSQQELNSCDRFITIKGICPWFLCIHVS